MEAAPLILTLTLDDETKDFFNNLRTEYFPPERNYLDAHCTLFHHLPGGREEDILVHLQTLADRTPRLTLDISAPKSIGRGVIFPLENEMLALIHSDLQASWQDWLTPQDRQKIRPHVTVQNKVSVTEARETFRVLSRDNFSRPSHGYGVGFSLFYYRNGPWEAAARIPFSNIA